jgi:hypothetical protein
MHFRLTSLQTKINKGVVAEFGTWVSSIIDALLGKSKWAPLKNSCY